MKHPGLLDALELVDRARIVLVATRNCRSVEVAPGILHHRSVRKLPIRAAARLAEAVEDDFLSCGWQGCRVGRPRNGADCSRRSKRSAAPRRDSGAHEYPQPAQPNPISPPQP